MEGASQRPEPRRRRRPALSCIQCRDRKIKCNREVPCRHCVSTGSHCAYAAVTKRPVPAGTTHSVGSSHTEGWYPTPETVDQGSSGSLERIKNLENKLQSLDRRIQSLEVPSSSSIHLLPGHDRSAISCSSNQQDLGTILNKTRITRSSNWATTAPEVQ